jgi:hypothetical protein
MLAVTGALSSTAHCAVLSAAHDLSVRLDPAERTLTGRDAVRLEIENQSALMFFLAREAKIESIEIGGKEAEYGFSGGKLMIELPRGKRTGSIEIVIEYSARFDDPYEPEPFAMDNPGQGVTGTMTDDAVFLLGGSGWYPLLQGNEVSMRLRVSAPAGMFAVTGGRALAHETSGGESISRWEIERAASPQALFAGRYEIKHRDAGDARVSTYFLKQTARLSDTYLAASGRHLEFFENLHGEYLFPKFAVVENFFPTGYGFPSFTLLGTRVLQLPFIPHTSLRHEIAHCWWGNGVMVDYDHGNWSEGLTTYVSEHLSKVRESETEARVYRVRALTDYALLAAGEEDFPLSGFYSRNSPASQAVGYGKAMFVFHMMMLRVGEENFWAALSDVYERYRFDRASWADFRRAMVSRSDWPENEAEKFIRQWVEREGAPVLAVEDVKIENMGGKWRTSFRLTQKKPHYALYVPVRVSAADAEVTEMIRMDGGSARGELTTGFRPRVLEADPEADVFRLLSDEEIPPTVNSIKGSDDLAAVISSGADKRLKQVFRGLLAGLNHPRAKIIEERDLDSGDLDGRDVVFFGFPVTEAGRAAAGSMPEGIEISARGFEANGALSSESADSAFIAYKDPEDQSRIKAFFVYEQGLSPQVVERTARKITHYGNYGLLAFERTENKAKDALSAGDSPLRVELGE